MAREYSGDMRKSATILAILGTIFITTPSYADSPTATPSASASEVAPLQTPEPRDAEGREIREPREHNENERMGLEVETIAIVVGAIFIAVGIAYGIGRRSHKR